MAPVIHLPLDAASLRAYRLWAPTTQMLTASWRPDRRQHADRRLSMSDAKSILLIDDNDKDRQYYPTD